MVPLVSMSSNPVEPRPPIEPALGSITHCSPMASMESISAAPVGASGNWLAWQPQIM